MTTATKDDYRVQQPIIGRLVEELDPGYVAEFRPSNDPVSLEMRVIDPKTGEALYASSGFWRYGAIADKSPDEIRQLLRSWGAGRQKIQNP
jgi:hypothetical protein